MKVASAFNIEIEEPEPYRFWDLTLIYIHFTLDDLTSWVPSHEDLLEAYESFNGIGSGIDITEFAFGFDWLKEDEFTDSFRMEL